LERKLTVVLAADVAGYSRLVAADEEGTLTTLSSYRADIADLVAGHGGRIFGTAGDSVIAEFASAVQAVRAAVAIQRALHGRNDDLAPDRRMEFRIGVNLGDVVAEGTDLLGDGVNVAARLQEIAQPASICISGALRDQIEGKLDFPLVSLGEQSLKNLPRPISVYRVDWLSQSPPIMPPAYLARPARHTIAVLTFDNMSGDPGQQYLSDGITEDIITELARFRGLSVAARHASAPFAGKRASIDEVRRALGVDYVVEGSVRRSGEQMRITVQLIDAATGSHVWAERYNRQVDDIFTVLDEVVATIASNLEDRVVVASAAQARNRPTESLTAYDLLLQGRELCNFHREQDAIPYFERAIAIDPDYALAHAWLGLALAVNCLFDADLGLLDRAIETGRRALMLDPNEPTGHWALAMALTCKKQFDAAGRHFDRAMALNPSDLTIRADWANWLRYLGRPEEALVAVEQALRRGPLAPAWFHGVRGRILFDLGRYDEAIAAIDNLPEKSALAWVYLAAAYGFAGNPVGAMETIDAARHKWPTLSLKDIETFEPYQKREALEHLLDGLRRAGFIE